MIGDFIIGRGYDRLPPRADDKKRDVIVGKIAKIRVYTEKLRCAGDDDSGFLGKFTFESRQGRLVFFHAATWKVPAGPVGVANQEDAIICVDDKTLRT